MNETMKRRIFLSTIVGTLIGAPIAVRLIGGGRHKQSDAFRFSKELARYRKMVDVPITGMNAPASFSLAPPAPPVGEQRQYVIFAPSLLPSSLSRAVGDDPDTFLAREGILYCDQTNKGQIVITGGDSTHCVYAPQGTEQKEIVEVSILLKDGQLRMAKVKGRPFDHPFDFQFPHLLSLQNPPKEKLSLGRKWRGNLGRVRPFTGFSTQYEVAGFDEVAGHASVRIAFSGETKNVLGLPAVSSTKPVKGQTMTCRHRGNAWFDLATGLLVRQETSMEAVTHGIQVPDPSQAATGPQDFVVKAEPIIQLLRVDA